ncbi:MAG TPA: FKBP-type peptidyl-prolyl cis-trans isomerase [Flavitalea sp.]|nr:FKBP-type peptidyl-prolyl cis-trans isomerase [Flavitalea sp.]
MKKIIVLIGSVLTLFLFQGCKENDGFKKTKSGILYKIISDGKGQLVKRGEFIKVNFEQKINFDNTKKDSLLGTSYTGMPTYAPVDSVGDVYNPAEIFPLLREGDSVVVVMLGDTIAKKNGELPPFMKRKDKITFHLKVLQILPTEELVRKDQQQLITTQKEKEVKAIEVYLKSKNINALKTPNGVYYEILQQGTGPKADSGKLVSVNYTGYTFDGKFFDSNIDSTKQVQPHPLAPFEFIAGVRGSIAGMLEAIQYFNKGGKGRLFVPSMLGYGSNPPPGAPFKAFDNLIFEIELLDVKAAPTGGPQVPQF